MVHEPEQKILCKKELPVVVFKKKLKSEEEITLYYLKTNNLFKK